MAQSITVYYRIQEEEAFLLESLDMRCETSQREESTIHTISHAQRAVLGEGPHFSASLRSIAVIPG
jgi:hypothetical protein